jgi:hypothetical protein
LSVVDGYITKPENEQLSLAARRPDLWQIPLTCESTDQEMPYLQIVAQEIAPDRPQAFGRAIRPQLQRQLQLYFNTERPVPDS